MKEGCSRGYYNYRGEEGKYVNRKKRGYDNAPFFSVFHWTIDTLRNRVLLAHQPHDIGEEPKDAAAPCPESRVYKDEGIILRLSVSSFGSPILRLYRDQP